MKKSVCVCVYLCLPQPIKMSNVYGSLCQPARHSGQQASFFLTWGKDNRQTDRQTVRQADRQTITWEWGDKVETDSPFFNCPDSLFVPLLTSLSCFERRGPPCLFQLAQRRALLSLPPLSIILTAARSSLQACCSIFWQETFLRFLYGLLLHYSPALVISILLQALLRHPICLLQTWDIFWWQWSIFMAVLMSSHFCLSLISRGTAYRKMNYTTQRTGWLFCSQLEANLPRQDLADVSS